MSTSLGFLTMAFGDERFHQQAATLALSLRLHMPDMPIGVVTDRPGPIPLFDHVVPIALQHGRGLRQKLHLDEYTPFAETLFIDSDSVVTRPFHDELAAIRSYEFSPIVYEWLRPGDSDPSIPDMTLTLGRVGVDRFPKFNGGLYFFRRGSGSSEVFRKARSLVERFEELGIRRWDAAGPNDEPIIALALESLGVETFDDRGRLMRTPLRIVGRLWIGARGRYAVQQSWRLGGAGYLPFCGQQRSDARVSYRGGLASRSAAEGAPDPWLGDDGNRAATPLGSTHEKGAPVCQPGLMDCRCRHRERSGSYPQAGNFTVMWRSCHRLLG